MIEKIFIPTVNRVNNQITFQNLPDELKRNVIMVVQAWERNQYKYNCDYLVLPDTKEYHFSDYFCLPKTRKYIYEIAKNMKYCILDDDIIFGRRNASYYRETSNMKVSRRKCTKKDIFEMFELFDNWLSSDEITVCGCGQLEKPLSKYRYRNNMSISSAFWINGNHFKNILPELDLTSVRVAEDVCFLLSLLSKGYSNRVAEEYYICNQSLLNKKIGSTIWDNQTIEQTLKDHKYLEKIFPGIYNIVYDSNGNNRKSGGYRNQGKSRILWSKAFNSAKQNTLEDFFNND